MVGKIFTSYVPYYDRHLKKETFKSRPILIIGNPQGMDKDYTVLPVSTIKQERFRNHKYDVLIEKSKFPLLTLKENCYIRTHKRTNMNRANINFSNCIGDLKNDYTDMYYLVLDKMNEYNDELMDEAI